MVLSTWCLLCDDIAASFDKRSVQARHCILGAFFVRNARSDSGESVGAEYLYVFRSNKGQAENLEQFIRRLHRLRRFYSEWSGAFPFPKRICVICVICG